MQATRATTTSPPGFMLSEEDDALIWRASLAEQVAAAHEKGAPPSWRLVDMLRATAGRDWLGQYLGGAHEKGPVQDARLIALVSAWVGLAPSAMAALLGDRGENLKYPSFDAGEKHPHMAAAACCVECRDGGECGFGEVCQPPNFCGKPKDHELWLPTENENY